MDFSTGSPFVYYSPADYMANSKLKIHRDAKLLELKNIKSSGRVRT